MYLTKSYFFTIKRNSCICDTAIQLLIISNIFWPMVNSYVQPQLSA